MGHDLLFVDDPAGCIEPCVLDPWFAYVDEAKELSAVRDILESQGAPSEFRYSRLS